MSIGETVKKWRESHGWTQGELAGRIGISQPFLSEFEGGNKRLGVFSAAKLQALSKCEIRACDCVAEDKRDDLIAILGRRRGKGFAA